MELAPVLQEEALVLFKQAIETSREVKAASRVHLGEVQLALAELNLQTARATVRQRILDQFESPSCLGWTSGLEGWVEMMRLFRGFKGVLVAAGITLGIVLSRNQATTSSQTPGATVRVSRGDVTKTVIAYGNVVAKKSLK